LSSSRSSSPNDGVVSSPSSACAKATILDVDVVEDDDERKPAKCAMESIIRSKRRGFIVCFCVRVCVCHFVLQMRSKKVRQKNI